MEPTEMEEHKEAHIRTLNQRQRSNSGATIDCHPPTHKLVKQGH